MRMVEWGISGTQQRIFVTTSLGCQYNCRYCYLRQMKIKGIQRIYTIVRGLDSDVTTDQIAMLKRERKFIQDMIVKAYGKTEKTPFSEQEDIAILHISDIQSGDANTTRYNANIWAEVARVCQELKDEKFCPS